MNGMVVSAFWPVVVMEISHETMAAPTRLKNVTNRMTTRPRRDRVQLMDEAISHEHHVARSQLGLEDDDHVEGHREDHRERVLAPARGVGFGQGCCRRSERSHDAQKDAGHNSAKGKATWLAAEQV